MMKNWSRGAVSGTAIMLLVTLALTLGVSVGRSRPVGAQASAASLTGTWVVSPNPEGNDRELASFLPGGVLLSSNAPTNPVEPGQGPPGASRAFNSQGFGVWASVGENLYAFKFLTIEYSEEGDYVSTATIAGRISLDATGNRLSGTFSVSVEMPDGTMQTVFGPAPLTGVRVTLT